MAKRKSRLIWLQSHKCASDGECLIWPFARYRNGYAAISLDGTSRNASRVMCELAHGPAPSEAHEGAHNCGNGKMGCVHPKHLAWKTRLENEADKSIHGTKARGEGHGKAKLQEGEVQEIMRRLEAGETQSAIGASLGVDQTTVSDVRRKRTWAWLTEPSNG